MRWTTQHTIDGAQIVASEYELIGLEASRATLRVWRTQQNAERGELRAAGEWNVHFASWPPLGMERVTATKLGGSSSLQATFRIQGDAAEPRE